MHSQVVDLVNTSVIMHRNFCPLLNARWSSLQGRAARMCSEEPILPWSLLKFHFQDMGRNEQQKILKSISSSAAPPSVRGIHCVDIAVHLVPKRQPGFAGEINLRVPTQASCSFAVAAPRCGRGQSGLCFFNRRCGPCDAIIRI